MIKEVGFHCKHKNKVIHVILVGSARKLAILGSKIIFSHSVFHESTGDSSISPLSHGDNWEVCRKSALLHRWQWSWLLRGSNNSAGCHLMPKPRQPKACSLWQSEDVTDVYCWSFWHVYVANVSFINTLGFPQDHSVGFSDKVAGLGGFAMARSNLWQGSSFSLPLTWNYFANEKFQSDHEGFEEYFYTETI